ncbi:MAG: hypothetical protein CSA36_03650 [Draconibacterium sp.]|nr:MAG: hypothetical protein CSA36_03650 [Draconibacterium sp.]
MFRVPERKWVFAGLVLTGILFVYLAFSTEVPAGGADNYAHFNIARWAFRYPHLFLDHWGKPLYTILAAPFAQFGFVVVRIMNSFLGLLTAWYIWKFARLLGFNNSWFAVVVAVYTPIYFAMMSSSMTEILFSLILAISIYSFFKEKYILSAILISFIFMVRTEGLAFLLLFFLGFLNRKQYKAIPLLATGFIFFSIVGWLCYYHDIFWLISQRPYATGGTTIYGRGTWYHYFATMPNYYGVVIRALLFIGTVSMLFVWLKEKERLTGAMFFQVLLVLGTFWGYFFSHAYLWWKGETSAGLQRVMAAVSPLIGIIALNGINICTKLISRYKLAQFIISVVLSVVLIINALQFYQRQLSYDKTANLKKEVTKWLIDSGSLKYKLVMHDPYYAFSTGLDAWDTEVIQYGFSNNNKLQENLADSTIFIWDAHFSANEGRMPYEKIIKNPNVEVIKVFAPEKPFIASADNHYHVIIFRVLKNTNSDNEFIIKEMEKKQRGEGVYRNYKYDFEKAFNDSLIEERRITKKDSSGYAFNLYGLEFSPNFAVNIDELDLSGKNSFYLSADFLNNDTIEENQLLLIFSIEKNWKSLYYQTHDIGKQIEKNGIWQETEFNFVMPQDLKTGSTIKMYVWNIGKYNVLMDNFKLEISKQIND